MIQEYDEYDVVEEEETVSSSPSAAEEEGEVAAPSSYLLDHDTCAVLKNQQQDEWDLTFTE